MYLDPERTTDVLADHPHLLLVQPKMMSRNILHHMRGLRSLVDRESRFRAVPIGNDCTGLQCHPRVAPEHELGLDDLVRRCKRLIDLTGTMDTFESEIVAK